MLKYSKSMLAITLAAMFLSTPLMSTASAATPDFTAPMQLELRSNHHSGSSQGKASSHSVRPSKGHKEPSHSVKHAPRPRYTRHDNGRHVGHRQPPPPPRREKHHHHSSGNDKLIGGLIAGAVIGAVIANNT